MKKTMYAAFVFAALGLTACKGETSEKEGETNEKTETAEKKETPTTFSVVAEESKLGWTGNWIKPGEEGDTIIDHTHTGTVQITEGSVTKDENEVTGNFVVDMTTINDTDLEGKQKAKLEGHLASEDFFNVNEYAKINVALNGIKDGMADITVNVMGMEMNQMVPVETSMKDGKMMMNGKFKMDLSALDFAMFTPDPEKPEEGNIDPNVEFHLKTTLAKK